MKIIVTLCLTVFSFTIHAQVALAPVKVFVKGFDGKPYSNDKVLFVGQKSKKTLSGVTNPAGKFVIQLPSGDIYDIRIQSISDEIEYNTIEIPPRNPESFLKRQNWSLNMIRERLSHSPIFNSKLQKRI
ncbi:hypothetical protein [Fluviicola sp.]|uniref:hypothetical protein n=1 Tax=Fluviicola sp. TaxID=1917219 RepID=UPI003D27A53D